MSGSLLTCLAQIGDLSFFSSANRKGAPLPLWPTSKYVDLFELPQLERNQSGHIDRVDWLCANGLLNGETYAEIETEAQTERHRQTETEID